MDETVPSAKATPALPIRTPAASTEAPANAVRGFPNCGTATWEFSPPTTGRAIFVSHEIFARAGRESFSRTAERNYSSSAS